LCKSGAEAVKLELCWKAVLSSAADDGLRTYSPSSQNSFKSIWIVFCPVSFFDFFSRKELFDFCFVVLGIVSLLKQTLVKCCASLIQAM
jgi:hypothetical protein